MTEQDSANTGRLERTPSVTTMILVILASLGVVLSLVGAWVRTTLIDTESFMEVVDSTAVGCTGGGSGALFSAAQRSGGWVTEE